MQLQVAVGILNLLLKANGEITGQQIAGDLNISVRTVYRYMDELIICGIPINKKVGKFGGWWLDEDYKKSSKTIVGGVTSLHQQRSEYGST